MGNHNTAEFWEYDTRLGRRWNVDPVVKPWRSSYDAFDNSPIWKLDPNGDDDYFHSNGLFSHSTKNGSNIYLQTSEGNKLMTEVNLKLPHNRKSVANIVGHYANEVGIQYQSKSSDKGVVGIKSRGKSSNSVAAFIEGNNIWVNAQDYQINQQLFDLNNLKSVLIHEKAHKEKGHGFADWIC